MSGTQAGTACLAVNRTGKVPASGKEHSNVDAGGTGGEGQGSGRNTKQVDN